MLPLLKPKELHKRAILLCLYGSLQKLKWEAAPFFSKVQYCWHHVTVQKPTPPPFTNIGFFFGVGNDFLFIWNNRLTFPLPMHLFEHTDRSNENRILTNNFYEMRVLWTKINQSAARLLDIVSKKGWDHSKVFRSL